MSGKNKTKTPKIPPKIRREINKIRKIAEKIKKEKKGIEEHWEKTVELSPTKKDQIRLGNSWRAYQKEMNLYNCDWELYLLEREKRALTKKNRMKFY